MMIGDQDIDAECVGGGDPVHARNAVVHRDQQVRLALCGQRHDLRRQAIAVLEAIGHDEIDVGAHRGESPHAHCTRGGPIRIVIGDDQYAFLLGDRRRESLRRRLDAFHRCERRQRIERMIELGDRRDASRRVHARQHRRQACGRKGGDGCAGWAPHDGFAHVDVGAIGGTNEVARDDSRHRDHHANGRGSQTKAPRPLSAITVTVVRVR